MRLQHVLLICITLGIACTAALHAQIRLQVISPQPNANSVPTQLDIRIGAQYRLDSTSISWAQDTTHDNLRYPSVLLVERIAYEGNDTARLWQVAQRGTYAMPHDSVFVFSTSPLRHGTQYVAMIRGIKVFDKNNRLQRTQDTVLFFSTTQEVPIALRCDLIEETFVSVLDTQVTYYSSKLLDVTMQNGNVTTGSGDLIEYYKTVGYAYSPDSGTVETTAQKILSESWLNADSTAIYSRIIEWNPPYDDSVYYADYSMRLNTSRLTGDSTEDRSIAFRFRGGFRLLLSASDEGGAALDPQAHLLYPSVQDVAFHYGDSVRVVAAPMFSGRLFLRWDCPQLSSVHQLTNPNLTFQVLPTDCKGRLIELNAVYHGVDSTFVIAAATHGHTVVRDAYRDSLYEVTGYLPQFSGRYYVIKAVPDSGYRFDYWDSANATINADTLGYIVVGPSTFVDTLRPVFALKDPLDQHFGARISIKSADGGDIAAEFETDPPSGEMSTGTTPQSVSGSIYVKNPAQTLYRISQWIEPDGTVHHCSPPEDTLHIQVSTVNPAAAIAVVAVKEKIELRVEEELNTGSANARYVGVAIEVATIPAGDTVWTILPAVQQNGYKSYFIDEDAVCIRATPIAPWRKGIWFTVWSAQSGYLVPSSPYVAPFYIATTNLTQPSLLKAVFSEYFQLTEVCFSTPTGGGDYEEKCTSVYVLKEGVMGLNSALLSELIGCNKTIENPVPGRTSQVRTAEISYNFSHPIDPSSMSYCNGTDCFPNMYMRDVSTRIDRNYIYEEGLAVPYVQGKDLFFQYHPYYDYPNNNVVYLNQNQTLRWTQVTTNPLRPPCTKFAYLPKFIQFQAIFRGGANGIHNLAGDPLWTGPAADSVMLLLKTEKANLTHEMKTLKCNNNHEWPSEPELFHTMVQTIGDVNDSPSEEKIVYLDSLRYPVPGGAHQIDDGDTFVANYQFPTLPLLTSTHMIRYGIATWEEDDNRVWTTLANAMPELGKIVGLVAFGDSTAGYAVGSMLSILMKAFFEDGIVYEFVGAAEQRYGIISWWGAHPSTQRARKHISGNDMEYWFDSYLQ